MYSPFEVPVSWKKKIRFYIYSLVAKLIKLGLKTFSSVVISCLVYRLKYGDEGWEMAQHLRADVAFVKIQGSV